VWPDRVMVTVQDSRLEGRRFHCQVTTLGKLFTHMCPCQQEVFFIATIQTAVMPCGWEGNRRSGGALAMCHRLSGLFNCGLNHTPLRTIALFMFTETTIYNRMSNQTSFNAAKKFQHNATKYGTHMGFQMHRKLVISHHYCHTL